MPFISVLFLSTMSRLSGQVPEELFAVRHMNILKSLLWNDGSTDESPSICEDWAQNDKRIHEIHKENRGLTDARNTGLLAAKGDTNG